jgi:hypothetical protein
MAEVHQRQHGRVSQLRQNLFWPNKAPAKQPIYASCRRGAVLTMPERQLLLFT